MKQYKPSKSCQDIHILKKPQSWTDAQNPKKNQMKFNTELQIKEVNETHLSGGNYSPIRKP